MDLQDNGEVLAKVGGLFHDIEKIQGERGDSGLCRRGCCPAYRGWMNNRLIAGFVTSLLCAGAFAGAGFAASANASPVVQPSPSVSDGLAATRADTSPTASPVDDATSADSVPPADVTESAGTAPKADFTESAGTAPKADEADFAGVYMWADFDLYRVTLTDGHKVSVRHGLMSNVPGTVSTSARGVFDLQNSDADPAIEGSAAYQINMLNKPTGYWIQPQLYTVGGASYGADCPIYLGDPSAGGVVAKVSGFNCLVTQTQGVPNVRYTFQVSLDRWAEVSGTVKAQGDDISLQGGAYNSNVTPFHVDGASNVAANSGTDFSVVLREGDNPVFADQARMEFSYQIVRKGIPQSMWVAGWVDNFRGATKFVPDARCAVYDVNPQSAAAPSLDQLPSVKVSAYDCHIDADFVHGPYDSGRGHYGATFTVSKRQMIAVTAVGAQKELMDQWCKSDSTCGFSNSTVTPVQGKEIRVTNYQSNSEVRSGEVFKVTTSGTEAVSVSNGFEIGVEAETNWIFDKFTASFKYNYNKTVTKTTITGEETSFVVPYGMTGWKVGAPDMERVSGEIIIYNSTIGVYYELQDVNTDFPTKDGAWHLDTRLRAIPPSADENPTPVAPEVLDGSANGGAVVTSHTADAITLANTGTTPPALPIGIGISALAAGAATLLIRRRRTLK